MSDTNSPVRPLRARRLQSPVGDIVAIVDGQGALVFLEFDDGGRRSPKTGSSEWRGHKLVWDDAALAEVARQLELYFAGKLREFTLPHAAPGNAFHREVWAELCRIPFGMTISYGELARRVGRPGSARAVGRANGANPVAIVVPCHRVIGADGKLTGYAGGIERKAALLALEQATTPAGQATLPLGVDAGPRRRRR
jgi:methylated-DNA-[protein]-cysteine S-methyltransferase